MKTDLEEAKSKFGGAAPKQRGNPSTSKQAAPVLRTRRGASPTGAYIQAEDNNNALASNDDDQQVVPQPPSSRMVEPIPTIATDGQVQQQATPLEPQKTQEACYITDDDDNTRAEDGQEPDDYIEAVGGSALEAPSIESMTPFGRTAAAVVFYEGMGDGALRTGQAGTTDGFAPLLTNAEPPLCNRDFSGVVVADGRQQPSANRKRKLVKDADIESQRRPGANGSGSGEDSNEPSGGSQPRTIRPEAPGSDDNDAPPTDQKKLKRGVFGKWSHMGRDSNCFVGANPGAVAQHKLEIKIVAEGRIPKPKYPTNFVATADGGEGKAPVQRKLPVNSIPIADRPLEAGRSAGAGNHSAPASITLPSHGVVGPGSNDLRRSRAALELLQRSYAQAQEHFLQQVNTLLADAAALHSGYGPTGHPSVGEAAPVSLRGAALTKPQPHEVVAMTQAFSTAMDIINALNHPTRSPTMNGELVRKVSMMASRNFVPASYPPRPSAPSIIPGPNSNGGSVAAFPGWTVPASHGVGTAVAIGLRPPMSAYSVSHTAWSGFNSVQPMVPTSTIPALPGKPLKSINFMQGRYAEK